MLTIAMLFFKGAISSILNVFRLIFSDWRILLAVVVLCAAAFGYYKWHGLQKDIAAQQQVLEQTRKANEVLEGNNKTLHDANAQNATVIGQLKKDQENARVQVQKLNTDLAMSSKKISEMKSKLDSSKEPVGPISPYVASAIEGIQNMQGDKK